ncbi:TIM23 complex component [Basidiobolus ranarum]|uniref:Presequence translocated-associated motor subunit PAM17 n=1 Tax=Basidiobolus ranarum TaxID=34480 RepID=A0ABR2W7W7_9FUNG
MTFQRLTCVRTTLPRIQGISLVKRTFNSGRTHFETLKTPSEKQPETLSETELSWEEYFQLRRNRRTRERLSSIPTTIVGVGLSSAYFASLEVDPTQTIFGVDPLVIYAAGVVASGFGGYLVGPLFGNGLWGLFHRNLASKMDIRDKEFYQRIKKHRSDPSLNSFRNPVPDFYGEKIKSVSDYRSWLRKQREHQRKATFFLGKDE